MSSPYREEIQSLVTEIGDKIRHKHKINLLGRCSCNFSSRNVDKITEHFMGAIVDELVDAGIKIS